MRTTFPLHSPDFYAGDPYSPEHTIHADVTAATLADADPAMTSQITVTTVYSSDSSGNEVTVTVTYPFTTFTSYPGISRQVTLTRKVQTRVAPAAPK